MHQHCFQVARLLELFDFRGVSTHNLVQADGTRHFTLCGGSMKKIFMTQEEMDDVMTARCVVMTELVAGFRSTSVVKIHWGALCR